MGSLTSLIDLLSAEAYRVVPAKFRPPFDSLAGTPPARFLSLALRTPLYRDLTRLALAKKEFLSKTSNASDASISQCLIEWANSDSLRWLQEQQDMRRIDTSITDLLYVIVRLLRPRRVIETGVSYGISSTAILSAMEANRDGLLHSVEVLAHLPSPFGAKEAGWIIPQALRSRWRLHVGTTRTILPWLCGSLAPIDMFFHDSEHTYSTMSFEYNEAWPDLAPGGLLVSHDVNANRAFLDFTNQVRTGALVIFTLTGGRPVAMGVLRKSNSAVGAQSS